jgi:hypothetical protein
LIVPRDQIEQLKGPVSNLTEYLAGVIVQRGWFGRPLMLIPLLDSMINLRPCLKSRDHFKDSSELTEGGLKCGRCRIKPCNHRQRST